MSLLKSLATDASIKDAKDSVGGNGPLASGLYPTKVALAYLNKAASGALGLNLTLKTEDNREIRQTLWMTSGTAKGGNNYYTDKAGEKQYLPGFVLANHLAQLTTGQEISELDTEQKVVNVYSFDAKAEVPTKVDMIMDLIGKDIVTGVIKQIVDKTMKNEATGNYDPTGETREENEIDKFFHAETKKTVAEFKAKAEEATFAGIWEQKWAGKERNKSKGAAIGGTAGAPKTAGAASAGTKKPTTSLFS